MNKTSAVQNASIKHDTKSFEKHMMTDRGVRSFTCHFCKYKTIKKSDLNLHSSKHKLSCQECDNKTFNKYHLKKHLMIRSGERPFHCLTCNYKAINKSNLKRHMMKHTGDLPFPCTLCDYKAAQKDSE